MQTGFFFQMSFASGGMDVDAAANEMARAGVGHVDLTRSPSPQLFGESELTRQQLQMPMQQRVQQQQQQYQQMTQAQFQQFVGEQIEVLHRQMYELTERIEAELSSQRSRLSALER